MISIHVSQVRKSLARVSYLHIQSIKTDPFSAHRMTSANQNLCAVTVLKVWTPRHLPNWICSTRVSLITTWKALHTHRCVCLWEICSCQRDVILRQWFQRNRLYQTHVSEALRKPKRLVSYLWITQVKQTTSFGEQRQNHMLVTRTCTVRRGKPEQS